MLIKGEGAAHIGEKMIEVSAGEAIYIPANTINKIITEENGVNLDCLENTFVLDH